MYTVRHANVAGESCKNVLSSLGLSILFFTLYPSRELVCRLPILHLTTFYFDQSIISYSLQKNRMEAPHLWMKQKSCLESQPYLLSNYILQMQFSLVKWIIGWINNRWNLCSASLLFYPGCQRVFFLWSPQNKTKQNKKLWHPGYCFFEMITIFMWLTGTLFNSKWSITVCTAFELGKLIFFLIPAVFWEPLGFLTHYTVQLNIQYDRTIITYCSMKCLL